MSASRRRTLAFITATLAVVAGTALAACGNGSNDAKLLSRSTASDLRSTLAQVEQQVESGDCTGAQQQVARLQQQVDSLDRVEADLRDALASGVARLQQLVAEECQAPATGTGTEGQTGTTDTGGATGPDEETDEDEPGKSEGKGKGKKKGQDKDEPPVEILPDTGTGGTGSGTTDSGGVVP